MLEKVDLSKNLSKKEYEERRINTGIITAAA